MTQIPIRGLFQLTKAALVVAAAVAVPYILKKNKRVAEQLGDTLMKAGEKLKKDSPSSEQSGAKVKAKPAAATAESKDASAPVAEAETSTKTAAKPASAKKSSVKSATKAAAKSTAKKSAAKPKKASTTTRPKS
ncbi:MAG: hypothetical protein KF784_15380 [Fimbriimonadaceae bacterium]|nr:hypothetical protein [Fimbriimonadaceae bacterium]